MLHIGFTGTQKGMTVEQYKTLGALFEDEEVFLHRVLHHGGCIGADSEAHALARLYGYKTCVHPGVNRKGEPAKRGEFVGADRVLDEKFYLDRNKDIVNSCEMLFATPEGPETMRSGTWSTVRFAKRMGIGGIIIMPDGSQVEIDGWKSTLDTAW